MTVLLSVEHISKTYPGVKALQDVSFTVEAGTVHAVMGENGAGKSTLMQIIAGAHPPTSGKLVFDGQDLLRLSGEALRAKRRQMQMIFQDPFASLNPRMRVGAIVAEPLAIHEPGLSRAKRRDSTACPSSTWIRVRANPPTRPRRQHACRLTHPNCAAATRRASCAE